MNSNNFRDKPAKSQAVLPVTLPLIWPDPRYHACQARYEQMPPSQRFFAEVDLISGVIVGAADETVRWIEELRSVKAKRRICLVLLLCPAGPTRARHLKEILALSSDHGSKNPCIEVRVLPMENRVTTDCEVTVIPPTVMQAYNSQTERTVISVGSVGDTGHDQMLIGSLNLVFQPDDAMRDAWRRWFEYLFQSSTPLRPETTEIPHLVPAKGDPEAARLWQEFKSTCAVDAADGRSTPKVDLETGEVTQDANGEMVVPWDDGQTALDSLAQVFQQVYANGWLVTVDESTRIKPLTIPVKATLLGLQSELKIGALKQKQSFTLHILDETFDKAIEKYRKVTDLMETLTYPLSQGNRWMPDAAKELLERELEVRNKHAKKTLTNALGGKCIKEFVVSRRSSIQRDLDEMYRQLGQGDKVPDDKFEIVLKDVQMKLTTTLDKRITPRVVYNRIGTPDLRTNAPVENWNQLLQLLLRSARMLRKVLTDSHFSRRFSHLSFSKDEFQYALDVFGDGLVANPSFNRARHDLERIEQIENSDLDAKEKCGRLWELIKQ